MAFTPAPVRDPFDKDNRASRSWVAWFAEVQQTITNLVAGSVTSVGLALPSQFAVTGSPVTGAGTLTGAWKNQTANTFLGGPTTGAATAPDFRALTTADIPALLYDPLGAAATVQTNLNTHTGLTGTAVHGLGTASTHAATDFDATGAASAVQGNLTTHSGLTGTAVHGLGNWSIVNYPTWASGTPFVKMTSVGTFALDTSTYLTSLSGAVLTDQTVGQTIGDTTHRLTKLWASDLTVTNVITGSVSGNAGTVTNGVYTGNIGSTVQAYSVKLAGLAGLTDAAGWYHSNGSGTYAWSTPTKSDVGLGSVENTALSTWAGSTNITSLGTVGTGAWNASTVTVNGAQVRIDNDYSLQGKNSGGSYRSLIKMTTADYVSLGASGDPLMSPGYGAGAATFDASGHITSVSDARHKDRIALLPYGLREVLALRPVQHGYNALSGLDRAHLYGGFLAQEVRIVMPLAVGEDVRGYLTLADRPILGAVVNAIRTLSDRLAAVEIHHAHDLG